MIYKTEIEDFHHFESYKERNLYYKIFGGYFFNELIPGYESRKQQFIQLLAGIKDGARLYDPYSKIDSILKHIEEEKWNVTFDYHIAQIFKEDKKDDRGEMSDVLILTERNMISIECKFLSNFSIDKDSISVQRRIQKFSNQFNLTPLQVLLLKKEKWNYSAKLNGILALGTRYEVNVPVIVIFWDDLLEVIQDVTVKSFLEKQIKRRLRIELLQFLNKYSLFNKVNFKRQNGVLKFSTNTN